MIILKSLKSLINDYTFKINYIIINDNSKEFKIIQINDYTFKINYIIIIVVNFIIYIKDKYMQNNININKITIKEYRYIEIIY